ncbi:MAG TPA: MFS transporter, partial [Sphingobium sp.]|nr:MFS transporter [Sphingobium sp.]
VVTMSLCFGAYFAAIVVIPQWLQISLGYTARDAGYVTAFTAMTAIIAAPVAGRALGKVDVRLMISGAVIWMGLVALWRSGWTSTADFWTLALPQIVQGFAMPFFMIPLTTLTLGSVRPEKTASAAGMQNFLRTLAVAVSTSLVLTGWGNGQRVARNEMVSTLDPNVASRLEGTGLSPEQVPQMIANLVDQQATVLAMNHVFLIAALILFLAGALVWLAPPPTGKVDTSAAH